MMTTKTRSNRFFATVRAAVLHPRTRHTLGFPPELTRVTNGAPQLPSPDVLVIEEECEGNVFLYRMTRSGEAGGDTWHQSINDAKHQAEYEYGDVLGEWKVVPDDVLDARDFAVKAIGDL
jgi:hypothetical protein